MNWIWNRPVQPSAAQQPADPHLELRVARQRRRRTPSGRSPAGHSADRPAGGRRRRASPSQNTPATTDRAAALVTLDRARGDRATSSARRSTCSRVRARSHAEPLEAAVDRDLRAGRLDDGRQLRRQRAAGGLFGRSAGTSAGVFRSGDRRRARRASILVGRPIARRPASQTASVAPAAPATLGDRRARASPSRHRGGSPAGFDRCVRPRRSRSTKPAAEPARVRDHDHPGDGPRARGGRRRGERPPPTARNPRAPGRGPSRSRRRCHPR